MADKPMEQWNLCDPEGPYYAEDVCIPEPQQDDPPPALPTPSPSKPPETTAPSPDRSVWEAPAPLPSKKKDVFPWLLVAALLALAYWSIKKE